MLSAALGGVNRARAGSCFGGVCFVFTAPDASPEEVAVGMRVHSEAIVSSFGCNHSPRESHERVTRQNRQSAMTRTRARTLSRTHARAGATRPASLRG